MEQRLIDANALPYENQVLSYDDEWCLKVSDINNAPTVDAVPVVHGRWLLDGRCSECLANPLTTHKTYCPNCGAKMMEVDG